MILEFGSEKANELVKGWKEEDEWLRLVTENPPKRAICDMCGEEFICCYVADRAGNWDYQPYCSTYCDEHSYKGD